MANPAVLDAVFGGGFGLPSAGLLSPEDQSQLRNMALLSAGLGVLGGTGGLGPALQQGLQAGQQAYQQGAMMALQLGDLRRQRLTALQRQMIFAQNPPPANPTLEEAHLYLTQVLPQLVQIGDTEMVGRLTELLKSVQGARGEAVRPPQQVDLGNRVVGYDPATGQFVYDLPKGVAPRDTTQQDAQRAELTQQREFQRMSRLADDYRAESKLMALAADNYRTIASLADSARQGQAAAQIGLIFAYMKTLDPNSVVRESEFANAKNAAGVPERVRNEYNRLLTGGFLAPAQVDRYVAAARDAARGWYRKQQTLHEVFAQRAKRWGVLPEDVLIDYFAGLDVKPKPPLSSYKFGGQVQPNGGQRGP